MKNLILSLIVAGVSVQAQALEFMKCNSFDGKTLYGTFGKRTSSEGEKYFAMEFVLFSSPIQFQERIIFTNSKSSMELVPMAVTATTIQFAVPTKGADGTQSFEIFDLRRYSHDFETAYTGTWTTKSSSGEMSAKVNCSVF